jgi:hypothetical protein
MTAPLTAARPEDMQWLDSNQYTLIPQFIFIIN